MNGPGLRYVVEVDYSPEIIQLAMRAEMGDTREEIMRRVILLTDQAVRDALINLGWTPPK